MTRLPIGRKVTHPLQTGYIKPKKSIDTISFFEMATNMTVKNTSNEFPLGDLVCATVRSSRFDGGAYVKLSKFVGSYAQDKKEDFILSAVDFRALRSCRSSIDEAWNAPHLQKPKLFNLRDKVIVSIEKHRDVGQHLKKMTLIRKDIDDPQLAKFQMTRPAWKNLTERMDTILTCLRSLTSDGSEENQEPSLRLNFKTLIRAEQEPRSLLLTRQCMGDHTWTYRIPEEAALKLRECIPRVRDALGCNKEVKYQHFQECHLTTVRFQEKMYVGFCHLDANGARVRGQGMNLDMSSFQIFTANLENLLESMYIPPLTEEQRKNLKSWRKAAPPVDDDVTYIADDEEEEVLSFMDEEPAGKFETPPRKRKVEALDAGPGGKKPKSNWSHWLTRQDSGIDMTSMNLEEEETCSIEESHTSINLPPKTPASSPIGKSTPVAPKKTSACLARRPMLRQYRWQWESKKGGSNPSAWFFSEASCRNEAERLKTYDATTKAATLVIQTRVVEKPLMRELIELFLRHYLSSCIEDEMKAHCLGCLYDAPGQTPHMLDGCLMEWPEAVEKYLDSVSGRTSSLKCRWWLRYILCTLDYPLADLDRKMNAAITTVLNDDLKEKMLTEVLSHPMAVLFRQCKFEAE